MFGNSLVDPFANLAFLHDRRTSIDVDRGTGDSAPRRELDRANTRPDNLAQITSESLGVGRSARGDCEAFDNLLYDRLKTFQILSSSDLQMSNILRPWQIEVRQSGCRMRGGIGIATLGLFEPGERISEPRPCPTVKDSEEHEGGLLIARYR